MQKLRAAMQGSPVGGSAGRQLPTAVGREERTVSEARMLPGRWVNGQTAAWTSAQDVGNWRKPTREQAPKAC